MRTSILLLLSAASVVGNALAVAEPITITETTSASGTFSPSAGPGYGSAIDFVNATVTFTITGDTSKVTHADRIYFTSDSSAEITVSGIGTFVHSQGFDSAEVSTGYCDFFNRPPCGGVSLYDRASSANGFQLLTYNDAFATYDFQSSLGPVTNRPDAILYTDYPVAFHLQGGFLNLTSYDPAGTFQATVGTTPEPSSLLLLGTGLAGIVGMMRRRFLHR